MTTTSTGDLGGGRPLPLTTVKRTPPKVATKPKPAKPPKR